MCTKPVYDQIRGTRKNRKQIPASKRIPFTGLGSTRVHHLHLKQFESCPPAQELALVEGFTAFGSVCCSTADWKARVALYKGKIKTLADSQ